jgi:ubiquitin-like protein Pup
MERKTSESHQSRNNESEEHQLDDEALKKAKDLGDTAVTHTDTEEIDDLLAEIDEVLESNAEEFVKSYVQKGGE